MSAVDRERWQQVRALLDELLEAPPAERERRLAESDPSLAAEVQGLLAADGVTAVDALERRLLDRAAEALDSWDQEADGGPASLAGTTLGSWRLERLLGRGGMAEVWEGRRIAGDFEQAVAVKLLKRGVDSEEIVRRFVRERQILARLDHPHVARLLDGGLAPDGRPFLVMEKVDGQPIADWCRERALPLAGRLRLFLDCCEAVAVAHRLLVVHRDLKPSNILVTADGTVKLLDFGIAKLLAEDDATELATRTELRLMTPAYAAPEQILGEPVTTATDVYALGVLAYELLTGKLPHRRRGVDLASAVASEVVERPSTAALAVGELETATPAATAKARRRWAKELAGDLDTIVLTALRRDPDRRYRSVAALAEDVERFLAGRPIHARPDSLGYRTRKFVGRHRVGVVSGALAMLALVAALGTAIVQAGRAEREAAAAREQAARAERQAARAERVRSFLASIFEVSDPTRARGEEVTARALLDEGARRVDAELAGEPELRGEMLDLLAGLYRKLGDFEDAKPLAERALTLRRETSGPDSLAAARSEWTLGWILLGQGDLAPARRHLEHAIAVLDRAEGGDRLAAADAREPLMELVYAADGPQATLPIVEQRLATYRELLGERDVRTALSLSDLGAVQIQLGHAEAAAQALRASAATLDELLPPGDPRAAYPHSNLAGALHDLAQYEEAEVEARQAIAIRTAALGPGHPETLTSRGQLTNILIELRRLEEAERNARETLELYAKVDRFGAAMARDALAHVHLRARRFSEALGGFEAAIAERREMVPDDHVLQLTVRLNRARALIGVGRRTEGLAAIDELVPILEAKGDEGRYMLQRIAEIRDGTVP